MTNREEHEGHENSEYDPCPKCGGRVALATGVLPDCTYDEEPFRADSEEPPGGETVELYLLLNLHLCTSCQYVVDVSIEPQ